MISAIVVSLVCKKKIYCYKVQMYKQEKLKFDKAIPVLGFYNQYYQHSRLHRNNIVEVATSQTVYFTTLAEKQSKLGWQPSTLFIYDFKGVFCLGYATQTRGFPFIRDVTPQIKGNVPLNQIMGFAVQCEQQGKIQIKHKYAQEFFSKGWSFKFLNKMLKYKWTLLLAILRYSQIEQKSVFIKRIVNDDLLDFLRPFTKLKQNHQYQLLAGQVQSKLLQQRDKISQDCSRLVQKNSRIEDQNRSLTAVNKQLASRVNSLEKQLGKLKSQSPPADYHKKSNTHQSGEKLQIKPQSWLNETASAQLIKLRDSVDKLEAEKEALQKQLKQQLINKQKQINLQLQKLNAQRITRQALSTQSLRQANEKQIEIQKLKTKLQELKTELQEQNQQLLRLKLLVHSQDQEIQNKDEQIKLLIARVQFLQGQNNRLESSLKDQANKYFLLLKEYTKKEGQCQALVAKFNAKDKDYEIVRSQLEHLKQVRLRFEQQQIQLKEQRSSKMKLKDQLENLQSMINRYEKQVQRQKNTSSLQFQQIRTLKEQIQVLASEKQRITQVVSIHVENLNRLSNFYMFDGDILEEYPQHKEFMKQSIQTYNGRKIAKTKKIYALEKDPNANFHKYVDQVPEIAVVVKTEAGFCLAGYSESPISTKAPASKGGLIMSLNNRKSFPVIPGKRSVTYDSFFLIIGNSEIRLKNQEWKVFSNFGIANSFFNNLGCGVNDLLGEGPATREVKIITFEVYKIVYE